MDEYKEILTTVFNRVEELSIEDQLAVATIVLGMVNKLRPYYKKIKNPVPDINDYLNQLLGNADDE